MRDPLLQLTQPDLDGIIHVTIGDAPVGEIVKSRPRIWNIDQNCPESATFYEALDTAGGFLDPTFDTALAASTALAKRAGIRL